MKQKHNKKKILLMALTSLVLVTAAVIFWHFSHPKMLLSPTNKPQADGLTGVNYNPPTEEEKQQAESNKDKVVDRIKTEGQEVSPSVSKKNVTPIITISGQNQQTGAVEVGAYIKDVFEDGGTCTLVLTNSSSTVSASHAAAKNVTDTTCGIIDIDKSRVTAGNWQALVSYSSTSAQGTSSSITLQVK